MGDLSSSAPASVHSRLAVSAMRRAFALCCASAVLTTSLSSLAATPPFAPSPDAPDKHLHRSVTPAPAPTTTTTTVPTTPTGGASVTSAQVLCAYVLGRGMADDIPVKLASADKAVSAPDISTSAPIKLVTPPPAQPAASAASASAPASACKKTTAVLTGSGDVIVIANKADWDKATAAAQQASAQLQLYINGISAGDANGLVGTESLADGTVKARFHVGADKTTRTLWSAIYRERDIYKAGPLRASVGWSAHTDALQASSDLPSPQLQVTTPAKFNRAIATIVFLVFCLIWCMWFTPIFRDGPNIGTQRVTFSLARVQVGLWLFYVVGAAVYLRLVLGALPTLEPSVAGLLVLSAATTVASAAVSSTTNPTPAVSQGFFKDILTSPDGTQQLHRLQALLVNGLLLGVGIDSVVQNLAYPVFDNSWLALLGISGITQAAMKQATETPSPNPGPGTGRLAGGAGGGAGGGGPQGPNGQLGGQVDAGQVSTGQGGQAGGQGAGQPGASTTPGAIPGGRRT
jgi:hypothetical protein